MTKELETELGTLEDGFKKFRIQTDSDVIVAGDLYHGYAVNVPPCPPEGAISISGACCVGDDCTIVTPGECADLGGVYQGNGTSCTPNPCVVTGACCVDTDCTIETQTDCESMGGNYQGDGTTCDPDPCAGCRGSTVLALSLVGGYCATCDGTGHTSIFDFDDADSGSFTLCCVALETHNFSGSTSSGGDGATLDWYINATSNGDGTMEIVWGGTISSCGSASSSFEFTESGFSCTEVHGSTHHDVFCEDCVECPDPSGDRQCSSGLCPEGHCCDHLLNFSAASGFNASIVLL